MNRTLRLGLVLPLALLLGAADAPDGAAATPHGGALVTIAVPFDDDFDACGGERVRVTGVQTLVGRVTQDVQGRWHFGFTRTTRGSGIGQTSGAPYLLNDTVSRSSLELPAGEPKVYVEQYSARLIRRGEDASADDAHVHFLGVVTLSADGEIAATVEVRGVECR